MTKYMRKSKDGGSVKSGERERAESFLVIMQEAEFREKEETFPHYKELLHSLGSIRYCKAEIFKNCILGTLRIPQKREERQPQIACGFYLTEHTLFLIEDTGDITHWVEKQMDRLQDTSTSEQVLLQLMEQMIENDILYLSHVIRVKEWSKII